MIVSKTQARRQAVWAKGLTVALAGATLALLTLGGEREAEAWPKYSTKEGKPCSYCHVNSSGGGRRNAAGAYYQKHNLSFEGYTPEKAAAEYGEGSAEGAKATPTPAAPQPATPKPSPKPTAKPTAKPTGKKPAPKKPAAKPTPKPAKKG